MSWLKKKRKKKNKTSSLTSFAEKERARLSGTANTPRGNSGSSGVSSSTDASAVGEKKRERFGFRAAARLSATANGSSRVEKKREKEKRERLTPTPPEKETAAETSIKKPSAEREKKPVAPAVITTKKTMTSRFDGLLFDPEEAADLIAENDLDHTVAMQLGSKVDEMVEWAPNVISWCADPRFLGLKPYARQAEILLKLFEEYCIRCSDLEYLADIPVADTIPVITQKIALLEDGVCPHCGFSKGDARREKKFFDPVEVVAVWGQRSGKCVVGDTEVLADGVRSRVEDLVGTDFYVPTKDDDGYITYSRATAFASGEKECLRLTLVDGSYVVLSLDHRVLTRRGWVEAGALTHDDEVGVPSRIPLPYQVTGASKDDLERASSAISSGERFPAHYWSLPSDSLAQLLSLVWKKHGYLGVSTAQVLVRTSEIADDLRFFLSRLGIASTRSEYDDNWLVRVSGGDVDTLRLSFEGTLSLGAPQVRWERVSSVEHVGTLPVYDLSVPETECFVAANMILHNSAVASMGISYLTHRIMRLPTPWKSYGLTPGQVLDFVVVATTAAQAKGTLWSTYTGLMSNSPWLRQYKAAADNAAADFNLKDEVVVLKETFLAFRHKHVLIHFASNNPASLRGATRFGGAIDELAWFSNDDAGRVRANGPETYNAISNSLITLRLAVDEKIELDPYTPLNAPVLFNISSPRAMDDAIMSKLRERAGDKRTIRSHLPTWRVNPRLTKAKLARELASPDGQRDIAANPPITDNPLIQRVDIVEDAARSPLAIEERYGYPIRPTLHAEVIDLDVPAGETTLPYISARIAETDPKEEEKWQARESELLAALTEEDLVALGPYRSIFEDLKRTPLRYRPHILGVDPGSTNNTFSLVASCLVGGKLVTDFACEILPTDSRNVNFGDVFDNFMLPLIERLNVLVVVFDRWQSLHFIHRLTNKFGGLSPSSSKTERNKYVRELEKKKQLPPFLAEELSPPLGVSDCVNLVSRLEQGDILFAPYECSIMEMLVNDNLDRSEYPFAALGLQLVTVRAKGKRLLKPVSGDDDLFRAWALGAHKAFTDQVVIDMLTSDLKVGVSTGPRSRHQSATRGYVTVHREGKGATRANTGTTSSGSVGGGVKVSDQGRVLVAFRKAGGGSSSSRR